MSFCIDVGNITVHPNAHGKEKVHTRTRAWLFLPTARFCAAKALSLPTGVLRNDGAPAALSESKDKHFKWHGAWVWGKRHVDGQDFSLENPTEN